MTMKDVIPDAVQDHSVWEPDPYPARGFSMEPPGAARCAAVRAPPASFPSRLQVDGAVKCTSFHRLLAAVGGVAGSTEPACAPSQLNTPGDVGAREPGSEIKVTEPAHRALGALHRGPEPCAPGPSERRGP
ncbi:unnamed protein product [Arctogadus glacialis]